MKVFSSLLWNSSKGRVEITGCVCILLNRPSWRSPTFYLGEKSICWHQIATCTMHMPLACWILMKSVGVMWTNMTRMQICNKFLSELQQSRSRPCHLLTFGQKSVMRKNPSNGICPAFLTQNTKKHTYCDIIEEVGFCLFCFGLEFYGVLPLIPKSCVNQTK